MRRGGPAFSLFRLMPDELVLEVFRAIDDQRAAAALCLAMPRHRRGDTARSVRRAAVWHRHAARELEQR